MPPTITSIKVIDLALGSSLTTLQQFVDMKKEIEAMPDLTDKQKEGKIAKLAVKGVNLEDMCLDFTVPGYDDLELKVSLISPHPIPPSDEFYSALGQGNRCYGKQRGRVHRTRH